MGRKRGHWPEFQIRPHYMSPRVVLMVYICDKMTLGSFWYQTYYSKSICSQVTRLNVQQNRGKSRPILTVYDIFFPQKGCTSMLFSWLKYY